MKKSKKSFLIEKNNYYIYAEKIDTKNYTKYLVYDGYSILEYDEENFDLAFIPYKRISPNTFLKRAGEMLIAYRNSEEIAKNLYEKVETRNVSVADILNIISFYENKKPQKEEYNYEEDLELLSLTDENIRNNTVTKSIYEKRENKEYTNEGIITKESPRRYYQTI